MADVGCGHGKNFAHYPPTVDRVIAVEPDAALRRYAERAAQRTSVPVRVVPGHADELPIDSDSVEWGRHHVGALLGADIDSALAEAHRVLRPGGELRFGEHVRAQNRIGATVQDTVSPLTQRMDGNCHQNRDVAAAVNRSALTVTRLRRSGFQTAPLLPGQPMIAGTAVKPDRHDERPLP